MPLILNIDTATEIAGICLFKNGEPIASVQNTDQKDHAAWLHVAIEEMMKNAGNKMRDLNAIAITSGPGSYTGLRVGMATAKGLCYALNIPLITENTLRVMAFAAQQQYKKDSTNGILLCPMIDARRMEVFTAIFNDEQEEIMKASAIVLDEHSFSYYLEKNKMLFFGNGSKKWEKICNSPNAHFAEFEFTSVYLGILAYKKFISNQFTDIIYSEPVYTKEFYTHTGK
ncbi:MAG: tRNA (adenosine(37)-N6)-threonylcarbamoyltransferase complex dimerization subunit type 1 TsaB [Bacteroidetes bacterium]|nr:tRNA (adenosine(37)-N6)-threonylcarbamoyltransferase complex dimerization subunit type 1 TsaB [Bacteroidota bacterium]